MDDFQQVLVSLGEIESILTEHDCPEPNPSALSRVRLLAAQMAGYDSYVSAEAARISALAGIFYSDRNHATHQGGTSALLIEIAYDLPNRIRGQIAHLRRIQKERDELNDDE